MRQSVARVVNEQTLSVREMFTRILRILRAIISFKMMDILVQEYSLTLLISYSLLIIGDIQYTVPALREAV